jgi:hypothetical protein
MKKFIFFLGFFYVISFFSCQQKNNKESFADIIKNDSSRVQELLDEAALLNNVRTQQNESESLSVIDPQDELNKNELANFRALAPKPDDDQESQTIIVSSQAIQELIGKNRGVTDSLIFYLGKYPELDQKRIDRYNKRNNRTGNPHNDHDYNTLGPRITFAIKSKNGKRIMSGAYDIGRLCPPPSTGCF